MASQTISLQLKRYYKIISFLCWYYHPASAVYNRGSKLLRIIRFIYMHINLVAFKEIFDCPVFEEEQVTLLKDGHVELGPKIMPAFFLWFSHSRFYIVNLAALTLMLSLLCCLTFFCQPSEVKSFSPVIRFHVWRNVSCSFDAHGLLSLVCYFLLFLVEIVLLIIPHGVLIGWQVKRGSRALPYTLHS